MPPIPSPITIAWLTAALLALCLGCSGPKPITGGTSGILRSGEHPLAEMQITIYDMQSGTPQPIGFAVTGSDGSFALVTNEARAPLLLTPGSYRCTIESAGSPVRVPPTLTTPATTPLQIMWTLSDTQLRLDVPFRLVQ